MKLKFKPIYVDIDVEIWHERLLETTDEYHERIFSITNEPIVFSNAPFPNEGLEIEETDAWHERLFALKDLPPMFYPIDVETYHERLF